MAANSAVRAGAGLVTLAAPASLNAILEVKTTEAMTLPLPDGGAGYLGSAARGSIEEALAGKDAVALGPGISWRPETAQLVRELATETGLPLVIDADGQWDSLATPALERVKALDPKGPDPRVMAGSP